MRIGPSEVRQGFEKAYRVGRLLGKLVLMVALYGVYVFVGIQCNHNIVIYLSGEALATFMLELEKRITSLLPSRYVNILNA